ncbi:MAG: HAMP domain-containing histidine kinase [bacterium]|nr:HAMP domain-containing histidine kinase [bacterium]
MNTVRHRLPPWWLVVVTAASLCLYVRGFILQSRVSVLPADLDPASWSYPALVEGTAAGDPGELRFLVEGRPAGANLAVVTADGAVLTAVPVPANSAAYLAVTGFSGACFWLVCAGIFLPRYRERHVPGFFWILIMYGGAVAIGGVFYQPDPATPDLVFGLLQLTCLGALPPVFLHLTLTFPERHLPRARARWFVLTVSLPAAALVVWQAMVFLRYFRNPGPPMAGALAPPQVVADVVMLVTVAIAFGFLIRNLRRLGRTRPGKQARWLAWGFAVGAAPYLLLRTLPQLLGLTPPLPAGADRILELAVPLSFVFAVVWDRLLDIDVIIRRSLLYTGIAAALVVLLVAPALILLGRLDVAPPVRPALVLLGTGLLAGFAYLPLRRRLGRIVDRLFFGLGHDSGERLERLREKLADCNDQAEVDQALLAALGASLACDLRGVEDLPDPTPWQETWSDSGAPGTRPLPDAWRARGFVLGRRLGRPAGPDAALLVGPRRSGRAYVAEDLAFLVQAVAEAEDAAARVQLRIAAAEEAAARRRLDELNRLKSDFLAQVAHDLRTPVTSATWSVRNLLDGLAGDLEPRQREYLESVRDAMGQLDGLVENLVQVSRLERVAVEARPETLDLVPCVEQAVSVVRPLAEAGGVVIELAAPEAVQAAVDREKLLIVLVNVLDNAVKYSPPDGRIEVACRTVGDEAEISVRDHGPGLRGVADPFTKFAQGRSSPHSSRRGFGLGLYVVRQYVELMGGSVDSGDADGGGAIFGLRLRSTAQTGRVSP